MAQLVSIDGVPVPLERIIGEGGLAWVVREGRDGVLKVPKKSNLSIQISEAAMSNLYTHRNIMSPTGTFFARVIKRLKGGRERIYDAIILRFPMAVTCRETVRTTPLREYLFSVVAGLTHIHTKGGSHRDFKCNNTLKYRGVVKVSDMGSVTWLASECVSPISFALGYVPPEYLLGDRCPQQAMDVWAVGMDVLYRYARMNLPRVRSAREMLDFYFQLLGFPARDGSLWALMEEKGLNPEELQRRFPQPEPLARRFQGRMQGDLLALITRALSLDYEKRPTMEQMLETLSRSGAGQIPPGTVSQVLFTDTNPRLLGGIRPGLLRRRKATLLQMLVTNRLPRFSLSCLVLAISLYDNISRGDLAEEDVLDAAMAALYCGAAVCSGQKMSVFNFSSILRLDEMKLHENVYNVVRRHDYNVLVDNPLSLLLFQSGADGRLPVAQPDADDALLEYFLYEFVILRDTEVHKREFVQAVANAREEGSEMEDFVRFRDRYLRGPAGR